MTTTTTIKERNRNSHTLEGAKKSQRELIQQFLPAPNT